MPPVLKWVMGFLPFQVCTLAAVRLDMSKLHLTIKLQCKKINGKSAVIRAPPLCGGRPIVISLSVRASVTNRVRAVTFLLFKTGFAYLACSRPPPDDVSRTIVGDL